MARAARARVPAGPTADDKRERERRRNHPKERKAKTQEDNGQGDLRPAIPSADDEYGERSLFIRIC